MDRLASDVLQTKQHALAYWNVDGLPTIFGAAGYLLFCGLFAVLIYILAAIGDATLGWVIFFLGLPVTAFVAAWFVYRSEDLIERLKRRTTYPRTGYAAPPSHWSRREREEASDASYGRWSGLARFLRRRWFVFYFICFVFGAVNDIFDHPLHPSLSSRAAMLLGFGCLGALLRFPAFLRDRLVALEILGYPLLGFLAGGALRKQQLLQVLLLFALGPPFLVLTRGVITLVRYLHENPMPQV